jgi:serine/threonine-protein phosphatase 2A activator
MSMPPPVLTTAAPPSHAVMLPSDPATPAQILTSQSNVDLWPTTPGFKGFWGWVQRRCERIKGREIMAGTYESSSDVSCRSLFG